MATDDLTLIGEVLKLAEWADDLDETACQTGDVHCICCNGHPSRGHDEGCKIGDAIAALDRIEKQEPVAFFDGGVRFYFDKQSAELFGADMKSLRALYTTPPAAPAVPDVLRDDYGYLRTVVPDKDGLHVWLKIRAGKIGAVLAGNTPHEGEASYCLGNGERGCDGCEKERNWQKLNELSDTKRSTAQKTMKRIDDTECILRGRPLFSAAPKPEASA